MYTPQRVHRNICSQNCKQRTFILIECMIEIYRIVIGTCLITFVPQNENYIWYVSGNSILAIAYYINIGTLCSFLALLCIEMVRENKIINYLEVTPLLSNDNKSVGEILEKLDPVKRNTLFWIDTAYVGWSVYCLGCFVVNTGFSAYVIIHNLTDTQRISVFVTNILFMFTKLYRIYYVIYTEKNIFYSAYLFNFVQFNDLDPREIERMEDIFEPDWISEKKDVVEIHI